MNVDTKMGELMALMPGARRALFAKYHLGGCQSCAFDDTETLAALSERAELDANEVLEHLQASHEHDLTMLIQPEEVKARIAGGDSIFWIDVRTREEHDAVKIPNSEFSTKSFRKRFSKRSSRE